MAGWSRMRSRPEQPAHASSHPSGGPNSTPKAPLEPAVDLCEMKYCSINPRYRDPVLKPVLAVGPVAKEPRPLASIVYPTITQTSSFAVLTQMGWHRSCRLSWSVCRSVNRLNRRAPKRYASRYASARGRVNAPGPWPRCKHCAVQHRAKQQLLNQFERDIEAHVAQAYSMFQTSSSGRHVHAPAIGLSFHPLRVP